MHTHTVFNCRHTENCTEKIRQKIKYIRRETFILASLAVLVLLLRCVHIGNIDEIVHCTRSFEHVFVIDVSGFLLIVAYLSNIAFHVDADAAFHLKSTIPLGCERFWEFCRIT